jgi:hypothetical protein
MFEKTNRPDAKDALANRIRRLGERKSQAPSHEATPAKSKGRPQRQPLYKQATVHCDGGQKVIVAVKNLSATGARIESRERIVLSGEVVLTEVTLGLQRRARVVWQDEGMAGLEFI